MNITQLSEQLKDVPQGTLIGYAKNPNSVVPQFLALAEIQRRQQLQAPASAPTGTVADDVLAQAAPQQMAPQQVDPRMLQAMQQSQQLPENQPGVTQLPSGMPQGMAGGGIVAFAGGGGLSLDDDEEDDREMARLFPQRSTSRFDQLLDALPSSVAGGIRGLADKGTQAAQAVKQAIPQSFQAVREAMPQSFDQAKSKTTSGIASFKSRGSHPYEEQAIAVAKEVGLDPRLMLHALYKETGGHKDPATAMSKAGAYGPMQLMEAAAKEVGVNRKDAYDNLLGGARYLKKQVDTFGDDTLALAAYNAGPGRVRQMLKRNQGIESLPPETQGYVKFAQGGIVPLAQGGKVQHFQTGGNTMGGFDDAYTDVGAPLIPKIDEYVIDPMTGEKLFSGYRSKKGSSPKASVPTAQELRDFDQASALFEAEQRLKPIANNQRAYVPSTENYDIGFGANKFQPDAEAAAVAAPKEPSEAQMYAKELRDMIKQQAAEVAQNKKMQLGLSLLGAAGSGLKSGSRYLGQGLGDTLTGGVSTYGALKKQEQDQAKDIMAAQLGMFKFGSAAEETAKNRALEKEYKDLALSQRDRIAEADRGIRISEAAQRQVLAARDDLRQYEQVKLKALQDRFPIPMPKDPNYQAALQSIYNDPVYKQLFALSGYTQPTTQAAPTGGVKQYNPKTGKVE
jgi:soluble lytic murein transglycosylase-like protein